jgi:hypothetical protein
MRLTCVSTVDTRVLVGGPCEPFIWAHPCWCKTAAQTEHQRLARTVIGAGCHFRVPGFFPPKKTGPRTLHAISPNGSIRCLPSKLLNPNRDSLPPLTTHEVQRQNHFVLLLRRGARFSCPTWLGFVCSQHSIAMASKEPLSSKKYVDGIYIPAGLLVVGVAIVKKEWLPYAVLVTLALGAIKFWRTRELPYNTAALARTYPREAQHAS